MPLFPRPPCACGWGHCWNCRVVHIFWCRYLAYNTGSSEHDIRKCIASARNCMAFLDSNIWHSSISLTTELRLYRVFILTVSLYVAETWSPAQQLERNLDAFDQWCLRRILRISWRARILNEEVRRRTDCSHRSHTSSKPLALSYR